MKYEKRTITSKPSPTNILKGLVNEIEEVSTRVWGDTFDRTEKSKRVTIQDYQLAIELGSLEVEILRLADTKIADFHTLTHIVENLHSTSESLENLIREIRTSRPGVAEDLVEIQGLCTDTAVDLIAAFIASGSRDEVPGRSHGQRTQKSDRKQQVATLGA